MVVHEEPDLAELVLAELLELRQLLEGEVQHLLLPLLYRVR